jgi:hypothetical protein
MLALEALKGRLEPETRARRITIAVAVYATVLAVYMLLAARETLRAHTPYNHFALLAEALLNGRLDLGGAPPAYAQNNDFAFYDGRWFVAFPPVPALLLLPLVALAGGAESVQDGQFFIWLAPLGPAVLFLALEKLRRSGQSLTSERQNLALALLFAFGTVYFFSAIQGTVWFAAHVVGVVLAAIYLLFALDAERPVLAGIVLGLASLTRPPLLLAAVLFVFESWRVASADHDGALARRRFAKSVALFALPLVAALGLALWYNHARFGDAFESGYRFLTVRWRERIVKWGLFSYHYLARNLGVMLTSLPYMPRDSQPFQINGHGLALWVTTPLYWLLLWPRQRTRLWLGLCVCAGAVALPSLLYQNSGWVQFGYRFSNDYAVFLFALLAIGGYRFRWLFAALALWAVLVNAFGAATFNRAEYARFYAIEGTQRVLYQPD